MLEGLRLWCFDVHKRVDPRTKAGLALGLSGFAQRIFKESFSCSFIPNHGPRPLWRD
jgi:hypothetical protein